MGSTYSRWHVDDKGDLTKCGARQRVESLHQQQVLQGTGIQPTRNGLLTTAEISQNVVHANEPRLPSTANPPRGMDSTYSRWSDDDKGDLTKCNVRQRIDSFHPQQILQGARIQVTQGEDVDDKGISQNVMHANELRASSDSESSKGCGLNLLEVEC